MINAILIVLTAWLLIGTFLLLICIWAHKKANQYDPSMLWDLADLCYRFCPILFYKIARDVAKELIRRICEKIRNRDRITQREK